MTTTAQAAIEFLARRFITRRRATVIFAAHANAEKRNSLRA
jgi:hypothetical protein